MEYTNEDLHYSLAKDIMKLGKDKDMTELGKDKDMMEFDQAFEQPDDDCMAKEMKNVLKYMIIREDGKLYTKWDDKGSLIF